MPGRGKNIIACAKKLKNYHGGVARVSGISTQWVNDFQEYLKFNAGVSLFTAAVYAESLRSVLNQAVKENILIKSPALGLKRITASDKEIAFLSAGEIRALFSCADNLAWAETARARHLNRERGYTPGSL
ncbi:MAG: phage integrase SAM-like domain-containing protein [Spirochaetaceae bacterium]|jgi:site-specific recombinase XerD|nr:phage integrase SAM-like domain-containing protein [Spirochaetaceae bacterium]